jgi:ubiquinone/menaquinone biosynthesis C-methylase UbiE
MVASTAHEIKDANVRYHDVAASDYDAKWGITYTDTGRRHVLDKLRLALGQDPAYARRSLEIGAGTGYFTLNLLGAGLIGEAVAIDISERMLGELSRSASRLGHEVRTVCCEAAELPFGDDSFDLVFGHAVLHHLPDLDAAFGEFRRVLRPGGALVFCGEPSRYGDRLAALPKQVARSAAPMWRRAMGAGPRLEPESPDARAEHLLEHVVDVHAFTPGELRELARRAGFDSVRVAGEELVAGWFGWANRTLESTAEPRQIPALWFQYAYRGYRALKAIDRRLLEPRLPPALFYNLLLSARAPRSAARPVSALDARRARAAAG